MTLQDFYVYVSVPRHRDQTLFWTGSGWNTIHYAKLYSSGADLSEVPSTPPDNWRQPERVSLSQGITMYRIGWPK